uniref:Rho-GAP domain-containing protein n=1 Tax=Angiostrongylus cantonensis TaxID=6313 RepID=A0A158P7P6_ANGCA
LHLCAYHSWLSSNLQNFVHGHVVVYSVRIKLKGLLVCILAYPAPERPAILFTNSSELVQASQVVVLAKKIRAASFAHARSAVARVLDDGHFTLSGEAILLVAVLHDYFSDEETNLLLVEGSELATSIGASFIAISPDANSGQTVELAEFFEHIRTMVPKTSTLELPFRNESPPCANIDQRDSGCFRKDSSRMYGPYTKSHSTGTLLSQSISGESTISAKPFEELMSASSAPTLRCPAPVTNTGYSPNVISPLCLPVPYDPPPLAPLAMPETVDVSTDYSMVQHSLPPEFFSYQSSTEPSASPPTTISQPSSASSLTSTRRSADIAELEQQALPKPPGLKPGSQRTKTSSMKPRIPPKPTTSLTLQRMTCSMPSRSMTMDVINRESVMKARRIFTQTDAKLPVLKQSLSVESFADLMGEKKKRFRFVRKVATSFRFKKSVEMERGVEKSINLPSIGSRSLPQSPQVERKARKPTYIGPPEKTNAFSWLSSRSPKRTQKAVVAGVVGATDTLQTLAEKNSGVPLFLMRCVEFIEKGDVDIASLDMPVHVVATAVKNFLSCLSEPLIPTGLHKDILNCLNRPKIIEHLRTIMDRLTPVNRKVLVYFISHLHRVASSPNTAMDIHNLSKVFFPTLFRWRKYEECVLYLQCISF